MRHPVAAPDRQLLGLDVDIAAVFIEDGAASVYLGRVLKMLVPSTGKRRSLKAIIHAVDPYDMPTGLASELPLVRAGREQHPRVRVHPRRFRALRAYLLSLLCEPHL